MGAFHKYIFFQKDKGYEDCYNMADAEIQIKHKPLNVLKIFLIAFISGHNTSNVRNVTDLIGVWI